MDFQKNSEQGLEEILGYQFTAVSFTIGKKHKRPKYPFTEQRTNCDIHTLEYYSALKKERNFDICYDMDET
jgi:hypothetical protein